MVGKLLIDDYCCYYLSNQPNGSLTNLNHLVDVDCWSQMIYIDNHDDSHVSVDDDKC